MSSFGIDLASPMLLASSDWRRGPHRSVRKDDDGKPHSISADLVVDASGRAVPTMSLLDKLDTSPLEVTEIGIDQAYDDGHDVLNFG